MQSYHALAKAKARLREAEDKVAVVRRWKRELPLAVNEYEGPARRLGGFLDGDLLAALAVLSEKVDALQAYLALSAPTLTPTPLPSGERGRGEGPPAPAAPPGETP